jgi:hypothetical protein
MWEEADMQERNTAVFSASALFEDWPAASLHDSIWR